MANRDITIAELPATTVADDNSYIPIDNGDITYKIKVSDYNAGANATARAYAEAAATSATNASASAGNAATYATNASQSAQNASSSANSALEHSNNASLYANSAYEYAAAASTSASNATSQAQQVSDYTREATERAEDAEAFAVGQRKGVNVDEEDIAYENNAKYYAELAASNKRSSDTAVNNSLANARIAEGFANGKQNGSAVPSGSEYYHNNAEYFSGLASDSANDAVVAADRAESAVVKSPYIGNNNHWYVYDFSQEQYVDTGVKATGDPGAPGQKGDPGVDGITPTITAAASVSNTSGTPSVTVQKSGSNTNPSFTFNFSGLKGEKGADGTSYDDTEIRAEIDDIWKVQGELGAKNLIPFPYGFGNSTTSGVTITVNDDGSVTLNGTATSTIYKLLTDIDFGDVSFSSKFNNSNSQYRITLVNGTSDIYCNYNPLDHYTTLVVLNGTTVDNLTVYPMLRYRSDTDDTWQPYVLSNKQLYKELNKKADKSIWKEQGKLGAKNLIPFPYDATSATYNGITWTINNDGSVTANGTATGYSFRDLKTTPTIISQRFIPTQKEYIASLKNGDETSVTMYIGLRNVSQNNFARQLIVADTPVKVTFTDEEIAFIKDGTYVVVIRLFVNANRTADNLTVYPMIRLATDPDDTWQPYAATNKQLTDKQNELAAIAGEYLPTTASGTTKKYSAAIGATTATFNASAFMSRYNATSSDLNLDISAETASGNVIAYNSVTTNSSGVVTITFDELTEAATFVCKCSKIQ